MAKLVISGGQSGADIGGVLGARDAGIDTLIRTFEGFKPIGRELPKDILVQYMPLEGNYVDKLRERNYKNVELADATLILVQKDIEDTKGSKLTRDFARSLHKPYCILYIEPMIHTFPLTDEAISISAHEVLNIAGERHLNESVVRVFIESLLTWPRRSGEWKMNPNDLLKRS